MNGKILGTTGPRNSKLVVERYGPKNSKLVVKL